MGSDVPLRQVSIDGFGETIASADGTEAPTDRLRDYLSRARHDDENGKMPSKLSCTC